MTARKSLLENLLRALVQEWGHDEVQTALGRLGTSSGSDALSGGVEQNGHSKKRRSARLGAVEQVARAHLAEAQAAALLELATRFDRKQFLPSISDVREFLLMMGERPGALKDRSDAFRRLLSALSRLPPERLEKLASSAQHTGPSQLGPLSDAISAAAASLPRYREPNAS